MRCRKRPHDHLQSAEIIFAPAAANRQVVAADSGAPTAWAHDGLVTEAREMLWQLPQALLDVLGKFQPILRVQPLELFLADRRFSLRASLRVLSPLAALNRPLESLVKVHQLIRSS